MKTIFKIAKAELNTLFYSPIAWFLCIVFLVQCAMTYFSSVEGYLTMQDLGPQYAQTLLNLTNHIFAPRNGLFVAVIQNLYLYIPLLTMGLISRETSSGTIKLLYSSPIKIREIVLGKFIAMMIYSFLLILILSGFVIAGIVHIHSADTGLLLSGLLGVYLLLCAYAAIGLFMSSLTSYQIVAAMGTLVTFGVLEYVGGMWQGIDFVRDLTYFLSISGRTNHMLLGLISTKDVLYFVLIVYIFIGFTIVKLQGERESKSGMMSKGKYVFIFLSALIMGYLSGRPALIGYYDASATKQMTLTANSQKIIKEFGKEPLEVTVYSNLVDAFFNNLGRAEKHNEDLERWEPYLRYKPDIKFNYVYYYDAPNPNQNIFKYNPGKSLKQIAQSMAKALNVDLKDFKTPEEIKKIIDLSSEQNRYVVQLKYKGRTTFLRVFDDMEQYPSETETDAALKRLTSAKFPKIVFLEGEFERSKNKLGDRDYGVLTSLSTYRYALVNQGFDVATVSLQQQEIPADATALVIADPKTNFSPVVLAKIQKFISDGGNLMIAGEPGRQAILNPLIQPMGVQLMDGTLVQKSKDLSADVIKPYFTQASSDISTLLNGFRKDSLTASMPGTAGLTYNTDGPYQIKPITVTDAKLAWNKKGKLTIDSADVVFSAAQGDERKVIPTSLALTRKVNGKQQRIVVTGDADFISNVELLKSGVNPKFATYLFGWFTGGQFPIDTSRPEAEDNKFNLTDQGLTFAKILFEGILPGLILVIGTVFLIRRKRK